MLRDMDPRRGDRQRESTKHVLRQGSPQKKNLGCVKEKKWVVKKR